MGALTRFLTRFFVPLLLALASIAIAIYMLRPGAPVKRDIRETMPVLHHTLSNGLTVVVMPNPRSPAVTHLLIVKAGAADDPQGKTGLAHYLEHLMFTGTPTHPEGAYDQAVARHGGVQNAYTTRDFTAYFATIAPPYLEEIMQLEADRLQQLAFDPQKAAREQKVITEERYQRVDSSAAAQLSEQLSALTFFNHPYRQPTIGWLPDMEGLNVADARAFYLQHYLAGNMVLVVAGDVKPTDVFALAQQYYGGLPGTQPAARNWPREPEITLAREATLRDVKAHEPLLLRRYVMPSITQAPQDKTIALALLAQWLGGGQTSLLYQRLVRQQRIALDVEAEYDGFAIGPALFSIALTPAPGKTPQECEAALDAALADAGVHLIDEAALTRARTLLQAEMLFAQDGVANLAHLIGHLYALGLDEQYFYHWAEAVAAVTPAQLQQATALLDPHRAVTGILLPAPPKTPAPAAAAGSTEAAHGP